MSVSVRDRLRSYDPAIAFEQHVDNPGQHPLRLSPRAQAARAAIDGIDGIECPESETKAWAYAVKDEVEQASR